MNNDTEQQKEIKLEALLKLKRHEQPDEHFWDKFEDELQQKTLQALVKTGFRKSLWQRVIMVYSSSMALPAAALLIITLYIAPSIIAPQITVSVVSPSEVSQATKLFEQINVADSHYAVETISAGTELSQAFTEMPASKIITASNDDVRYIATPFSGSDFTNTLY